MKDCAGRCCAICLHDICSAPLWGSHTVLNSLSPPPAPVKAPDLFPASQSPLLCMFIGTLVPGRRVTPIIQDELISRSLTWLHQQGPFLQRGSQVPGVRSGHVLLGITMPPTTPGGPGASGDRDCFKVSTSEQNPELWSWEGCCLSQGTWIREHTVHSAARSYWLPWGRGAENPRKHRGGTAEESEKQEERLPLDLDCRPLPLNLWFRKANTFPLFFNLLQSNYKDSKRAKEWDICGVQQFWQDNQK